MSQAKIKQLLPEEAYECCLFPRCQQASAESNHRALLELRHLQNPESSVYGFPATALKNFPL